MMRPLVNTACEPYRKVGRFAYHFARAKLGTDPVYRSVLELGLLQGRSHILDLGCGQGLLAAWLRAARHVAETGQWPSRWAPAPRPRSTRGIELKVRDVARAVHALGTDCGISQGDIRCVSFGSPDAVVMLDVLHYMDAQAQEEVLRRVRAALPPGGLLLLRVGDASGGLRFRYSKVIDRIVTLCRGHAWLDIHCRSIGDWQKLLAECGFRAAPLPMSEGTPFANVLLVAHAD